MALPKLTATDEMKQIAASDLPRKEKTTYGYVREVCEYYAYLRCITQDGILKVAFFLPEHLRLNGSNPAYEVYLDKEKRQFITYNSLTQKWCESKLDRLDWKRLYWYAKTSWVSEEDMTAVQTYLGSDKKAVDAILLPMYRNGAAWKKKPPKHRSPRRNRLLQQRNRQSAKPPSRHPPRINHPKRLRPLNLPVRRKALSPQTRIPSCLEQNYQIHRRF